MKKRTPHKKKKKTPVSGKKISARMKRCWEFFQCHPDQQHLCLLVDIENHRCWTLNLPCCKIGSDTPRPISVKKVVCKTCEYYKTYKD